ncbi:FAD-dependent monooxygenase [Amycolatopsis lurida]
MKVCVLGAGPAGLYLSILLKRADPAHEIEIFERNAPGATFGWGVVFSEETLGELRDADYATFLRITDTFARWDAIDIRYRGEVLRSRGHGFSAIARKKLLAILQERCRELGVVLRFETSVEDPAELPEADLVVAADGVNSVLRRSRDFGTRSTPQGCKYIWYGTDLVLDAFRFSFAETEHGLIQTHSYPFDEHTSTVIVECPEPTWRAAGLDRMSDEESIAFCEDLFARDLDGHSLLSNKSAWLSFPRIRNRRWSDGNVVLIGDSAHTAHFSIGSGTKLAMEDAVSLANAFVRHGHHDRAAIRAALVHYELERRPMVDRFQQAAADSAGYFERVRHHTGLPPRQFAVNLLTRSGRISHANLALRDAEFVRRADLDFAGEPDRLFAPPPFLTPLQLGKALIPNRLVVTGEPRGAGLVRTAPIAVSEDGRITPETQVGVASYPVDAVHEAGALAMACLTHAGRRGATRPARFGVDVPLPPDEAWPLLSASAVPYGPLSQVPKAADEADLKRIRDHFASAAAEAATAGFDLLELDFAQGRLLASFLSPLTNPAEDRLRFPLEVLGACREAWPEERPLVVRLTVTDWAPRGATIEDGVAYARAFAEAGASMIHVEAGQTVAETRPVYRRGFLTALSDRIRAEAAMPTLVGGHLTSTDEVNTVLAAGRADLCLLDVEA